MQQVEQGACLTDGSGFLFHVQLIDPLPRRAFADVAGAVALHRLETHILLYVLEQCVGGLDLQIVAKGGQFAGQAPLGQRFKRGALSLGQGLRPVGKASLVDEVDWDGGLAAIEVDLVGRFAHTLST